MICLITAKCLISFEIVIILVLIAFNGIFAMSEFALVSAKKIRLRQQAEEGDTRAAVALKLANEPTSFLSTIQIGITLVGIFAGAFGGATIAEGLAAYLRQFTFLSTYSDALSITLVVSPHLLSYLNLWRNLSQNGLHSITLNPSPPASQNLCSTFLL